MKRNDFVLPILIILLIFFVPATIYGVHKHNSSILDRDNPKHLPKKDGKLYFYDENDVLIGVYECKNANNCDHAVTSIDDDVNMHYNGEGTNLPVYNGSFAFVQDGNEIYYYWLKDNSVVLNINSIKNYGVGISGGLLILQDEYLKYGLFDPNSGSFVIDPIYDYMGLIDGDYDDEGKLNINKLIVEKDNSYYLIDETQNELSAKLADPIYGYDNDSIYTKTDLGNYSVLDYQGVKKIPEDFKVIKLLNNSNALITTDFMVRIYSKDYINLYYDKKYDTLDISFEESDNVVSVINNENVTIDTVDLTVDINTEEENPEENEENIEG